MVAGSGANQDKDESSHEPSVRDVHDVQAADLNAKDDGYNAGVPGPLTRIFIIGNRGIANLIQDLILVSIMLSFSDLYSITKSK